VSRSARGDRGAASLWLLTVGLLLFLAGGVAAAVGAAAVARHRAAAAADLGALAGARWALWGAPTACPEAAAIVAANGGRLTGCAVVDADVVVEVEVAVRLGVPARTARARARAGPLPAAADAGGSSTLYVLRDRRPGGAAGAGPPY
jgi:secretion/DNA translocation related TadE-like protein